MSSKVELTKKLGEMDKRLEEHDDHIRTIFEVLRKLVEKEEQEEKAKNRIGFVKEPKAKYVKKTKAM